MLCKTIINIRGALVLQIRSFFWTLFVLNIAEQIFFDGFLKKRKNVCPDKFRQKVFFKCHWMEVPTPEEVLTQEVYKGFRFNFGVGLLREVPLDGSAHARGSAHAIGL